MFPEYCPTEFEQSSIDAVNVIYPFVCWNWSESGVGCCERLTSFLVISQVVVIIFPFITFIRFHYIIVMSLREIVHLDVKQVMSKV